MLDRERPRLSARSYFLLSSLLLVRLIFHALFVPAYEGPDEIPHLSRIADYADQPFSEAFTGRQVSTTVLAAAAARPCAAGRHGLQCQPFGSTPASFNLLRRAGPGPKPGAVENLENNQPPLFYMATGLALRTVGRVGLLLSPDDRLLAVRLLGTLLVALAVFWPLRQVARRLPPPLVLAGFLLLFLPGASESLVRCANDQAVFVWAALSLLALECRASTPVLVALMAAGPLLKLTALPVVAFVLVALWLEGRRLAAAFGALGAALVMPIQLLRGWSWGGTYELNRPGPPITESISSTVAGLARSLYTVWKTTFWLGEWSFFHAPLALVLAFFLLTVSCLFALRFQEAPRRTWAHLAGAVCAATGTLVFIVANRRFFGSWGGVGGWYLWVWLPWLLVAGDDLFTVRRREGLVMQSALAAFVVVSNVCFYVTAYRIYG